MIARTRGEFARYFGVGIQPRTCRTGTIWQCRLEFLREKWHQKQQSFHMGHSEKRRCMSEWRRSGWNQIFLKSARGTRVVNCHKMEKWLHVWNEFKMVRLPSYRQSEEKLYCTVNELSEWVNWKTLESVVFEPSWSQFGFKILFYPRTALLRHARSLRMWPRSSTFEPSKTTTDISFWAHLHASIAMSFSLNVRDSMMIAHSFRGDEFGPAQQVRR